jgi:hypothetical protein
MMLGGIGLGIPGAGAIAGLASLNPAAGAATAALALFRSAINGATRAAEDAKRMYANSLMSGFGLNFTTQRSQLAKVIGVGENEVFQFGTAVSILNDKLRNSTDILSKTNPTLTMLSWNASVLKSDFSALTAELSYDAAPAIELFIKSLDELVKWLTDHSSWITNELFGTPKERNAAYARSAAREYAEKQSGQSSLIPWMFLSETYKQAYKKKYDEIIKSGATGPGAPPPIGYIKQMRASQWEHMGLVIGGAGGTNYNKNIDHNTKRMASILETMPEKIAAAYARYNSHRDRDSLPSMP